MALPSTIPVISKSEYHSAKLVSRQDVSTTSSPEKLVKLLLGRPITRLHLPHESPKSWLRLYKSHSFATGQVKCFYITEQHPASEPATPGALNASRGSFLISASKICTISTNSGRLSALGSQQRCSRFFKAYMGENYLQWCIRAASHYLYILHLQQASAFALMSAEELGDAKGNMLYQSRR